MRLSASVLFRRYLIMFGSIALVTVVGIILPFYSISVETLTRSAEEANALASEVFSVLIDRKLKEIELAMSALSLNDDIIAFCAMRTSPDDIDTDVLTRFQRAYSLISYLGMSKKDGESVILYSAVNGYALYSDGLIRRADPEQDAAWLDETRTSRAGGWTAAAMEEVGAGTIHFLLPVSPFSHEPPGWIVARVDAASMLAAIFTSSMRGRDIAMTDPTGNPAYATYEPDDPILEPMATVPDGASRNLGRFIYAYRSEESGFRYIVSATEERILKPIRGFTFAAVLIAVIMFALGMAMAYRFSLISYRPIKKTADILADLLDGADAADELNTIMSGVATLKGEVRDLKEVMDPGTEGMRRQFVRNLLNGYAYNDEQRVILMRKSGIPQQRPRFVVVVFSPDHAGSGTAPRTKVATDSMVGVIESRFPASGGYLPAPMPPDSIVVLVGLDEETLPVMARFDNALEELSAAGFEASVGISAVHAAEDQGAYAGAYAEAAAALERRFFEGGHSVYGARTADDGGSAPAANRRSQEFPKLDIKKIANFVMAGDAANAVAEVDSYEREIEDAAKRMPPTAVRVLWNATCALLQEIGAEDSGTLQETYTALFSFRVLRDYAARLKTIVWKKAESKLPIPNVSRNQRNVADMATYIDGHFTEDLTLTHLADLFGLSSSYASTLINQALGCSLVTYVNRKRIELVKRLLKDFPYYPVHAIAEKAGFHSVHTFIRAFKKEEGVTPSSFRDYAGSGEQTQNGTATP